MDRLYSDQYPGNSELDQELGQFIIDDGHKKTPAQVLVKLMHKGQAILAANSFLRGIIHEIEMWSEKLSWST